VKQVEFLVTPLDHFEVRLCYDFADARFVQVFYFWVAHVEAVQAAN